MEDEDNTGATERQRDRAAGGQEERGELTSTRQHTLSVKVRRGVPEQNCELRCSTHHHLAASTTLPHYIAATYIAGPPHARTTQHCVALACGATADLVAQTTEARFVVWMALDGPYARSAPPDFSEFFRSRRLGGRVCK